MRTPVHSLETDAMTADTRPRGRRRPRVRHVLLGLAALLALLTALPARAASPDTELKRARDRFEYGDYADAARQAQRLVAEGRLTTDAQLVEAFRILGLSNYYRGRTEEARTAFVSLLSIEPDYRLDPFFHAPKVVEFFDAVKADNEALLAPLREQKRRIAEERRRQEAARRRLLEEESRRREARSHAPEEGLVVERVVSNHEYLVNWLPFGAGQFQNGQPVKGGVLAAGQAVTGAASVVGFAVVEGLERCREVPVPTTTLDEPERVRTVCAVPEESLNLARNMDRVKWVAGGLFWGLLVYGIVDAHLHYEPYTLVSEERRPARATPDPEAPRARLHLTPWAGPDGAGAALTLVY